MKSKPDPKRLIKQLAQLQKQYTKLYHLSGFCGVSTEGVQMHHRNMIDLLPFLEGKLEFTVRGSVEYPIEISITAQDVKFYAILSIDDLRAVAKVPYFMQLIPIPFRDMYLT